MDAHCAHRPPAEVAQIQPHALGQPPLTWASPPRHRTADASQSGAPAAAGQAWVSQPLPGPPSTGHGPRAVLFVWTPGLCRHLQEGGLGPASRSHQGPATHTRRAHFTTFPSSQPRSAPALPDSASEVDAQEGATGPQPGQLQPRGPEGLSAGTVVSESRSAHHGARACCPPEQGHPVSPSYDLPQAGQGPLCGARPAPAAAAAHLRGLPCV